MDEDRELTRVRRLMSAGFVFLFSAYFAFGEVRYLLWARKAEANVATVREIMMREGRGPAQPKLVVEYYFDDNGKKRSEKDILAIDWPRPSGKTVTVEYIPGVPDDSRLAGHRVWWGILVFLGSLAVFAFFIHRLAREANEPIRKPAGRRR